jgi:hypothetical protein
LSSKVVDINNILNDDDIDNDYFAQSRQFGRGGHSLAMPQGHMDLNWNTLAVPGQKPVEQKEELLPVMNNPRLEKFSSQYTSDKKEAIEQKCFFLFAGTDLNAGQAFKFELVLTKPDDPSHQNSVQVNIKVDNLTIEQCSDVIVSFSNLVPDFKTVLRYDDLHDKPSRLDLEKKIRYQAPLYYIRKQIVKGVFTEMAVKNHMIYCLDLKRQANLGGLEKTEATTVLDDQEALEKHQLRI